MRGTGLNKMMAVALLAGAAAACDTGTGPEAIATFDAEAALEDYRSLDVVLSSDTWQGFQALGAQMSFERIGAGPALAVGLAQELRAIESEADAGSFASALIARIDAAGGVVGTADALISDFHRGKTFVYDFTAKDYVVDPDRTGAPSNGVRFIVYEHDRLTGKPTSDVEIGYADLIDEGDGSAEDIALRLVVVMNGLTALDYKTTVDNLGDDGAITVAGFLQDEQDRLDFDIAVQGSERGGQKAIDVSFEMGITARDFSISGSVKGTEGDGSSGDIDVSVRHGSESLRVDVNGTDSEIAGTFYLNGQVFATVSGDPDEPTFLGASGDPLTGPEVLVLLRMVGVLDDVFDLFEELVEPVGHLVILAVLL